MALIDDIRALRIADYDYDLPDERIAKHPLAEREQCKLLYYKCGNGEIDKSEDCQSCSVDLGKICIGGGEKDDLC